MRKEFLEDRINFVNAENDEIMGFVTFPMNDRGVLCLDHTEVSDNYQGRGLAAQLVQEVAELAVSKNQKIIPICPYAVKWFEKNPKYGDVLEN